MSNASRLAGRREKKVRQPRTKKIKVDLTKLPDAIVDGKFVVKEKGRVYFERLANRRVELHTGDVWKVDGDMITLWDDQRGQFYHFSMKQQLPVIKAASSEDVLLLQEGPDRVGVDEVAGVGDLGGDPREGADQLAAGVEGPAPGVSEPDGR